ncbi:MAG: hypothetical protein IJU44_10760 [Kiritimatiellae bacterium]|nr:hypothetical protein [Kiritimatiellia bacterium]
MHIVFEKMKDYLFKTVCFGIVVWLWICSFSFGCFIAGERYFGAEIAVMDISSMIGVLMTSGYADEVVTAFTDIDTGRIRDALKKLCKRHGFDGYKIRDYVPFPKIQCRPECSVKDNKNEVRATLYKESRPKKNIGIMDFMRDAIFSNANGITMNNFFLLIIAFVLYKLFNRQISDINIKLAFSLVLVVPVFIFIILFAITTYRLRTYIEKKNAFGDDLTYLVCSGYTNELNHVIVENYYTNTITNSVRYRAWIFCDKVHELRQELEGKDGK